MTGIVERAQALALRAHAGQTDKAGEPYVGHLARVAARVADDPIACAMAWLHDLEEDQPGFAGELAGFPAEIREGVHLLNRNGKSAEAYYAGIRACPRVLRVKCADLDDNSAEDRLSRLPSDTADRLRAKYAKARQLLGL